MSDPRYNYQDLAPASITVAQLDALAAYIISPDKTMTGFIVSAIKILIVAAYIFGREKLVAIWADYAKQKYEQGQASSDQSQIGQDPLSGVKR